MCSGKTGGSDTNMAHGDSDVAKDDVTEVTISPPPPAIKEADKDSKLASISDPGAKMDVDKMLSHAGDFGRYQYLLMLLFSVINILSTFDYFGQLFIFVQPEYWCHISELPHVSPEDAHHVWTPPQDPSCSRYDVNLTTVKVVNGTPDWRGSNWTLRHCDAGWDYNLTDGYRSIISELDWVCDDSWKPAVAQSMFFVGSVLGSLGLGIMSDHVGRLPVLILANMLALCGNVATVFTSALPEFSFCRMITGLATDNNFVMMYIIVLEYMRPNRRTLGLNLCIGVFHTLACIAVPWVAIWAGNWRLFLLVITIPNIVVPGFYFCVPESASWLLSKGRVKHALRCFQRVAAFNGKKLPPQVVQTFETSAKLSVPQGTGNLLGLFKTPRLRRKTCILIFKSMVLTLCFDAISRNVDGLGYSPFVMFSMTSVTKFPASLIILLLQDRIGRKAMASGSLLISGVFTIASGLVIAIVGAKSVPMVTAGLAVVGRFGVNIAYSSGAQYAAELIPTEVRGQGVSAIHMVGYAATFFSSHILYLATYSRAIPELVLGGLSIIGAALCLLLPETLNRTLPVTLEDGEAFGEGEGVWEFAWCQKSDKKYQHNSTQDLVS
ncbi:organic cation transporter protein-like isoform X2 [Periplaneta americana]|uniref:organic cation transporter protein-like isoform X2 n=1 Tax=Periplaneta americana TaxID=6978 RepID=UPI0037E7B1D3